MHKDLFRKAKVLIVDDEPSNVRLLERILEVSGKPETRSTTDPRQTLSLLLEMEPDIVLLDLHMPHLDGFAVMELLKAAIPSEAYLPVLILTADITPETKKRAFLAGAKDFVTKPLDHSEVIYRIKNLLENRFLHLELQSQNASLEQQVRIRTAELEQTLVELRSTQEQVVKQERLRALGMMAGGIAHDFNNALTMMLGYGELLVPYLNAHGSGKETGYLDHMISAAQDARHVVSRLREFYRPRSADDERVAVDLNAVVERAVSMTSPKWKGSSRASGVQINVQTDLAEGSRITGSAGDLAEVLTNLIFNAVDAMPAGGNIKVSTRQLDDRVRISVADSGVGMSETDRLRCLEPFYTTKGEDGTGLGLSVVYGIIQRHGGTIDIRSTPGMGTCFDITLPIFTESETRLIRTEEEHEPVGPLRILVVDDQVEICELIAEYLSADGHESITAKNGSEGFDRYCNSEIDLVITDQSMPDMNGAQLAAAIKQKHESARVILLTGFGDEMIASGSRPENVDLILAKPISAADLRRAVSKAVQPRRASA